MKNIFALALILALTAPLGASAATKPSCVLTVASDRGEISVRNDKTDVLALPGEVLTLRLETRNAREVVNEQGEDADRSDTRTIVADSDDTFGYTAINGRYEAECLVNVEIVEAGFDTENLVTDEAKPTLNGTADVKSVDIRIEDARGKKVFEKKKVKVSRGEWKTRITKSLKEGEYTVILKGPRNFELNTLATSTLTMGKDGSSDATITVSSIPLLMGGTAKAGMSVPVAYIQVANPGKETATIDGFTLTENGSAPDDVVIGFTVNDDKGGSRATIGGTEGTKSFKNGSAFVPLAATIAPGQLRIFTVKAIMGSKTASNTGLSLKIDTASIATKAEVRAKFPIRGTTFILAR